MRDASGWARQRSRLGRWRAPFWQVVRQRFHLTAGCCVTVPFSQTTDLTEDTQEVAQVSLWDGWRAGERDEKPLRYLRKRWHLNRCESFSRGAAATSRLLTLLFIKDRMLKRLARRGSHWKGVVGGGGGGLDNCLRTGAGWNATVSASGADFYWHWKDQGDSVVYTIGGMRGSGAAVCRRGWAPSHFNRMLSGGFNTVKLQPFDPFSSPRLP